MNQTMKCQTNPPSQNEIALLAYLNWEKAGKPANSADRFWIEAEAQLHVAQAQAAELAAKFVHQWPPVRTNGSKPVKLGKSPRTRGKSTTPAKLTRSRKHKLVRKKS